MSYTTAFHDAMSFTLEAETGGDPDGGFNDLASDRGGATKWGVSQRAYPQLDIQHLSREGALSLYWTDYWLPAKCDLIPLAPVAAAHMDCAVNSGVKRAALLLQGAFGAKRDGDIGPKTIAALTSFAAGRGGAKAAAHLIEHRGRFLCNIVDEPEKPNERQNLKNIEGWVVRLIRLTSYVSRLA